MVVVGHWIAHYLDPLFKKLYTLGIGRSHLELFLGNGLQSRRTVVHVGLK